MAARQRPATIGMQGMDQRKEDRFRRTNRQVSENTRDVVGLHFLRSGRQAVEIDGEGVILGPGDAMIWDGSSTGGYEILEPLQKTTLILPRSVAATGVAELPANLRAGPGPDEPANNRARPCALDTG
jgi:hypothetical protein